MSLNLLTVPNDYDLYVGSLTIDATNPHGSVMNGIQAVITAVPITFDTNCVPTGYTVRGTDQTIFPAVLPFIEFNHTYNALMTIITIKIPQFHITSFTGTAPTLIELAIPPELLVELIPTFPIAFSIPLLVNSSAPTFATGVIVIESPSLSINLLGGGAFGPGTFGLFADVNSTYSFDAEV